MWKIKMVEAEKEKLLREHAGNLGGFLHPDLVEKAKLIAQYEGEPAETGYLNNYKFAWLYSIIW